MGRQADVAYLGENDMDTIVLAADGSFGMALPSMLILSKMEMATACASMCGADCCDSSGCWVGGFYCLWSAKGVGGSSTSYARA